MLFTLLGSRRVEHIQHRGRRPGFRHTTGYSCGTALDLHQLPSLRPGIRALRVTAIIVALDMCINNSAGTSGKIDAVLRSRVGCTNIIA